MPKVCAYGRDLEIVWDSGRWKVFELGNEGKKRASRDVVIPGSVREDEIVGYLSDLLHEYATAKHPGVTLLS